MTETKTDSEDLPEDVQALPDDVREILTEALDLHRSVPAAQARVTALISGRNAKVIALRARGVSGYRIAQLFDVSQTAVGEWTKVRPKS